MKNILLVIIIICLLFIFINRYLFIENFYVTTWTPYVIDFEHQPAYSNYFYDNGYMYPVY